MPSDVVPTAFVTAAGHSRRAVDRAGDILRDWMNEERDFGQPDSEAVDIAWAYRSEFQRPLTHVVMGLRTFVRTEGAEVVVAQRLKRLPRIIEKLTRSRRANLSRMQDIGGCRAILPDLETVERVRHRIRKRKWKSFERTTTTPIPRTPGIEAFTWWS